MRYISMGNRITKLTFCVVFLLIFETADITGTWGQCNPWTKSLGPLDLGLVQVGLHWCNPWTSYLLDQTYTGTLGN